VKMAGPEFGMQDAGLLFPIDSPGRRRIDTALLTLRRGAIYQKIYNKCFGSDQQLPAEPFPLEGQARAWAVSDIFRTPSNTSRKAGAGAMHMVRYVFRKGSHPAGRR